MASPRSEAQFRRARWTSRLLIPVWILQLVLALGLVGLFSWRVGATMKDHQAMKRIPTIEYVWLGTNIGMALLAAICSFVEIVRFFSQSLTPWTMMFTNIIKLTCASAILALDIVAYIILSEQRYSLVSLGVDGFLLLFSTGMTTYAIIAFRRTSAYDEHSFPPNVKSYGFNDDYSSYRQSVGKRSSLVSARLSIGSAHEPFNPEFPSQSPNQYTHRRDTQFEDYMASRASAGDHSAVNDDALLSPSRLSPSQNVPSDLHISTGLVQAVQRGAPMPRSASWQSDHVLVSVPEEEHESADRADEVSLLSPDQKDPSNDADFDQDSHGNRPVPKWQQNRT